MKNTIAITGYGIISAIGNNAEDVLTSLKGKSSGIGQMQYLESIHKELPVGEVKLSNSEMKHALGIDTSKTVSRTSLLAALAVRQALAMAGGNEITKGRRLTFLSGTTVGGMDVTERCFLQQYSGDNAQISPWQNDCACSTEKSLELLGLNNIECSTVSTACSSALNAIIVGSEMLKNDETDIVIAGGSEALSVFHLNGFNTLMILDKQQCRPFDETRAGLNLGEGAAFIVLECTDKAIKRNTPILGWIAGYGNACDAFHQTASSENGEGAYLAMQQALKMAQMKPSDIQYVNAHGTGTPNNDASESEALKRVFKEKMPPVSSTKSFTGHTTSASGSIEAVISLLAMKNNFIPCNLGWKKIMQNGFKPTREVDDVQLENVLCNSFGFGGNDSSLILSTKEPTIQELKEDQERYVVHITAESVIDCREALNNSRKWISPIESRRMGKLLKAAIMTSLDALQKAGVESPDAIVTATAYGMLETTEQFLTDIAQNGETLLKPTLFMQSTHNTLSSSIAIRTKCHGYNITYSHGKESFDWAMRDARRLIETGQAKTVLVGYHDEAAPDKLGIFKRMGFESGIKDIYSKSIVLTC